MQGWSLAIALTGALVGSFAAGWVLFRALGVRSPNAWVTTLVLLAGSLGGPVVATALLGHRPVAYLTALAIAGVSAGATFWPMGETQGEREWL